MMKYFILVAAIILFYCLPLFGELASKVKRKRVNDFISIYLIVIKKEIKFRQEAPEHAEFFLSYWHSVICFLAGQEVRVRFKNKDFGRGDYYPLLALECIQYAAEDFGRRLHECISLVFNGGEEERLALRIIIEDIRTCVDGLMRQAYLAEKSYSRKQLMEQYNIRSWEI